MPRIPTRQVQEKATTELLRVSASPDAFGAGIGKATSGLGDALASGGDRLNALAVEQKNDQRQKDTAAGAASFDYSKDLLTRQQNAPADGKGFYDETKSDYDAKVDAHVAGIPDNKTREAVKQILMARKPGVMSASATFEVNANVAANRSKADEALGVLENKVRADPTAYDQAVADGKAVLATRTEVPQAQRDAMGRAFEQNLAKRTFEARLAGATTPEQVQAIENDLTAKDSPWQARMGAADFDRILDGTKTTKAAINTQADAAARAALDTIAERHNSMAVLDPAEMSGVEDAVKKSKNFGLQIRWADIKAQQQVYRMYPGLSPQQYRDKISEAKTGNAAGQKFNLPAPIADAINEATGKTGISSTYLAGMFNKEYGGSLRIKSGESTAGGPVEAATTRMAALMQNTVPGVKYFSAFNDQYHQGTGSRHAQGLAFDMVMDDASKAGSAVNAARSTLTGAGLKEGEDFTILNEYESPSKRSTGGHIHVEFKSKEAAAKFGSVDYGVKNPDSSATGVAQFTNATWLGIVKGAEGFNARLMGIDVAGKSDEQLLALRSDPKASMIGAAILAKNNGNAIQRAIGRPATDGELYMAHFLGAGGGENPGAIEFIRALQADPNQEAAKIVPAAAAANRSIFYSGTKEGGTPRTVAEVNARLSSAFGLSPTRIGYVRAEALQKKYDDQQKGLKEDMVSYGAREGKFVVGDLGDQASWQQRGNTVRQMADYFSIPSEDVKPFTKDEAERFGKTLKDGSADEVLGVLTQIQSLGGDVARAAAKQLGESDAVFGFAAGLANDRGQVGVATDVIRGRKRLNDDKDIKAAVGDKDDQSSRVFADVTGRSMMGLDSRAMSAIRDAAMAHYVETHVARGGGKYGQFDKDAFTTSIQAVMGGTKGAPAIESVNGAPTVIPPGITGREFDTALDRMTTEDYTSMSIDGNPPRFRDGSVITPAEIATEGKFRAIGGGQYQLEMADGRMAISSMDPRGLARPYTMKIDGAEMKRITQRPTSQSRMDETVPPNDNPVMQPGGVMSNFDPVTGRWKGPSGGRQ